MDGIKDYKTGNNLKVIGQPRMVLFLFFLCLVKNEVNNYTQINILYEYNKVEKLKENDFL